MLTSHSVSPAIRRNESGYFTVLEDLFKGEGWCVNVDPLVGQWKADFMISRDHLRYVVECKVSSEGRRDRLIPLLSQTILEARVIADSSPEPASPLAIVAAPHISPSIAKGLQAFLADFAPDVAAGIFDRAGYFYFHGPGLEGLNVPVSGRARRQHHPLPGTAHLFSDLNQWMLKVLLAPHLSPDLLRAPRGEYRNASELAIAAEVSVMSSFRFVRQLRQEGFLDSESEILRLVRREELMNRWRAAHLRPAQELPMRWIISAGSKKQLPTALHSYSVQLGGEEKLQPRACLGLFSAAEALGVGFVHGVPPYLYLENLDKSALSRLGLRLEAANHSPDVYVRRPASRESIFRGSVVRDGVPVADIVQVWLDVSSHPARGAAQAEEIRRRVLTPFLKGSS